MSGHETSEAPALPQPVIARRLPPGVRADTVAHLSNQDAWAIGMAWLKARPDGVRDMRSPIDIGLLLVAALNEQGLRIVKAALP